ncbi:MAG: PDZ domain-containing protein [Armatimonadetes bacterium]|nr:MAG: PDZ domain-containing protein [Armatimonadota bacterium]
MIATLLSVALLSSASQLTAPVEAPFRLGDDAIIVDVMVNGRKISCMFDTGFGGWLVVNDQINLGKATGTARLRDFVGEFEVKTVPIQSFQIGGLSLSGPMGEIVQQPLAHMTFSYGTHTDGIMGLEPIMNYVTEINFEKQKFIFHPRSVDITKRTPDNKRTFLVKMLPRGINAIELTATVNGKPLYLALDTGNAFYATTHKESLERVGLWDPNRKPDFLTTAWVASGPVDSFYVRIPKCEIFGVPVEDSIWSVIDLPSSGADSDGTVGFGFLKHFNIIFDYERRYVWLENWSGKVTDPHKGHVGFRVQHTESGDYVVFGVFKGGPAEAAGIKDGDRLRVIDGKSVTTMTPEQVEAALEGDVGSVCKVAVSRQGSLIRAEIQRKVLANEVQ